jgi:glycosyltransferase involved in cell wall biosynthesis
MDRRRLYPRTAAYLPIPAVSVVAVLPASCTLIAPHQRATSGGVYVIEQLAQALASSIDVNLAVRKEPLRAIEGVNVLQAPRLDAGELPDAEIVIGGLAQPDPERVLELPPSKGAQLFFFQGYGTPDNPRVRQMLELRPRVLAVSSFLVERARGHGCEAELIRPGFERSIFHPGPVGRERGPVVAMMTHATDWKATEDGLSALARVRAAIPGVELKLFGGLEPDRIQIPSTFLGRLSRAQVGELLRETAVLVLPSWEEGLGLPGIEALACGAALATTDTKGGRDYALHGETALVTPPRRPDLLADSVIRLLREPELCVRLAQRGQARVLATYPPWPEAAAHFEHAIARLLSRTRSTAPSTP